MRLMSYRGHLFNKIKPMKNPKKKTLPPFLTIVSYKNNSKPTTMVEIQMKAAKPKKINK